eukprot:TRINITY_DN3195_c0_g1_i1.p1 TRINITY_DN3195_c0_g1~~TRINITY_DN3195_c0_g1_i1.p1  ORF type:complete len:233 (+),score=62.76 TRINITY_DN3195_c0_g1_i1:129-827(+)
MADASQKVESTMPMLPIRTRSGMTLAKDLEHIKKQLTLCLQLGSKVPAIWIRASGRDSEEEAANVASLGLEEQGLLAEVTFLMKQVPQSIFGIATGLVGAPAGLLLKVCDYVFAESSSRFMPATGTMGTGQEEKDKGDLWRQSFCMNAEQAEAAGLVDLVLETGMLRERCQKMIHHISRLRSEKFSEIKEHFRTMKLRKQCGSKKVPMVMGRSSTQSTELGSIAEDDEEDEW